MPVAQCVHRPVEGADLRPLAYWSGNSRLIAALGAVSASRQGAAHRGGAQTAREKAMQNRAAVGGDCGGAGGAAARRLRQ